MSYLNTWTVADLKAAVSDPRREGELYDGMQFLRERFTPDLVEHVRVENKGHAIARAVEVIFVILDQLIGTKGAPGGEPGHGLGHWARDYLHSLYLAQDPVIKPWIVLPGLIAGTLHDIGTRYLDRYTDKGRAFRHAEAGALLVRAAALETGVLTEKEADLVAWAIAAHTHYLRPSEVACADGVTRTVTPYEDQDYGAGSIDGSPKPFMPIWLPRWADRLDCSGPCMVGRHYLTLAKDHEDYSQQGFYKVTFAEHLQPLLRTQDEIKAAGGKQTMLEHMRMFANSQTTTPPYGWADSGRMVPIRDAYRASLDHIIGQVARPTLVNVERMVQAWSRFLKTIEPTVDDKTVQTLEENFRALDRETQVAWTCGFRAAMTEYLVWADRMCAFIYREVPEPYWNFPGLPGGLLGLTVDTSLTED